MNLFNELKRRNVFRVGIAYLVSAWVIAQVAGLVLDSIKAPDWVMQTLLLILGLGFIISLIISWAYEVTPEGIKKEQDVVRDDSITNITAKKLDYVTLLAALGVLALFAYQQLNPPAVSQPLKNLPKVSSIEKERPPVSTENVIADASIAVLPFADLSPAGDQEYFSDGISEELLNVLVRVEGLTVASRTSSFGFKGQEALGIPLIAKKLKVRHVLEGSVRKSGQTIRITAQLIDAQTDAHLWSQTFDRQLSTENIFTIQDEISSAIVSQLRDKLGANIGENLSVKLSTLDLKAYDLYLQAKPNVQLRRNLSQADNLLVQAVEQDPKFVEAWELRAIIYTVVDEYGGNQYSQQENINKAKEYSNTALSLDSNSSIGLAIHANLQYQMAFETIDTLQKRDWSKINSALQKAISINPNNLNAVNWLGLSYAYLGKLELSLSKFQRCLKIDPYISPCAENEVSITASLGRDQDALASLKLHLNAGVIKPYSAPLGLLSRLNHELAFKVTSGSSEFLFGWHRHDELYEAYKKSGHYSELAQDIISYLRANTNLQEEYIASVVHPVGGYALKPAHVVMWDASHKLYRQSAEFKTFINNFGIHDYWRSEGFPPQCKPVGVDDFECD